MIHPCPKNCEYCSLEYVILLHISVLVLLMLNYSAFRLAFIWLQLSRTPCKHLLQRKAFFFFLPQTSLFIVFPLLSPDHSPLSSSICFLVHSSSSSIHSSAACWLQSAFGCLRWMVPSMCSNDRFLLQLFLLPKPVHLHLIYLAVICTYTLTPACPCPRPHMFLAWWICLFTAFSVPDDISLLLANYFSPPQRNLHLFAPIISSLSLLNYLDVIYIFL